VQELSEFWKVIREVIALLQLLVEFFDSLLFLLLKFLPMLGLLDLALNKVRVLSFQLLHTTLTIKLL
jgi:hypothetical protein